MATTVSVPAAIGVRHVIVSTGIPARAGSRWAAVVGVLAWPGGRGVIVAVGPGIPAVATTVSVPAAIGVRDVIVGTGITARTGGCGVVGGGAPARAGRRIAGVGGTASAADRGIVAGQGSPVVAAGRDVTTGQGSPGGSGVGSGPARMVRLLTAAFAIRLRWPGPRLLATARPRRAGPEIGTCPLGDRPLSGRG